MMIKINETELRDIAYRVATGNHLVESFSFDEFQKIDVNDYAWEALEHWDEGQIVDHIAQIAEGFMSSVRAISQ